MMVIEQAPGTMFDSPVSLQNICIDFICENLEALCEVSGAQDATTSSDMEPGHCVFRDENVFIPAEISEQLLATLGEKKKLTDFNLTLFDSSVTRLRHVKLRNSGQLTPKGLRVLRNHKVFDLEATGLKVTVNDLIGCLGDWTLQNLRSLNVARSTFLDNSRYCVVVALSKLKALHSLNVSNTEFNRHGLEMVAEDLPQLESLDISSTWVDDIAPLRRWKTGSLKTLRMYNLKVSSCDGVAPVLIDLRALRVLDVSDERDTHPFETFNPVRCKLGEFVRTLHCCPLLTSLDLSGKEGFTTSELQLFLKYHPHLNFLGLLHSDTCYADSLTNHKHSEFKDSLVVTGTASEGQILAGLDRYPDRPLYVQKCLYNLFRLTPSFCVARVDVIKLVLRGMSLHTQQFGLQMAATACLYNLTKGDLASKIHPVVLKDVVELTLTAMETFPNHYQLQKNTLLTLCSDRILQEVTFNKFHCATLVMNCLCTFDDASMNRMSVAICSILAAKISTKETSQLGARPQYMRKLLDIVQGKVNARQVDITVKFTLSALWNLTDESPQTCRVFLQEQGMPLFLAVLETFPGEAAVETKVLGLINNIAEVPALREKLMVLDFLVNLRKLLHSGSIDVSYFAAGIIAHLASDPPATWTIKDVPRNDILEELGAVVGAWETPDGEMVAYRSFRPFFPLLTPGGARQVQLWAAWAVHHVCTKNAKRYCPMLVSEGGDVVLRHLLADRVESDVRSVCDNILEVLRTEGFEPI